MMPGSPDAGIVNTAGLPMGTFVAGPNSEPVYNAPVDVVGVVAPLSVSSPVDDAAGVVAPISLPVAATAEPKRTAATAADAADTPPTTSVRRSRESGSERLTKGARSPSSTGQTAASQSK